MVAVLQRFWSGAAAHFQWAMRPHRKDESAKDDYKIGEFRADYSPLSSADLVETDPAVEALIQRSKVVSVKRGL